MTAMAIDKPRGRAWWKELWIQVLIAMAAGIALGIVNPEAGAKMQPLGDAFIKAIRMLIAPIIFCTVVHGIAHMADMARVGRVAIKAIVYFEIMTTIAPVIGLIAVNVLKPGVGMNIDPASINASAIEPYVKQTGAIGFVPFLMNIVPATFIGAFAEGNILQVLFISVLCGFALVQLGERAAPLVNLIDIAAKMVFAVVGFVMWAAPIGAFGAIAFTVGKFGVASLASLGKLLGGFYLTCVVFIIVALGPVARLCGFSLLKLIRYIWEELLICIATTSSETVLPRMLTKLEKAGCEKSVVRAGDPDRLFLQSRWHLSLPRRGLGVFGAGNQYAIRARGADRAAADPAGDLQGRGGNCGRGLCRAGGDAIGHRHHSGDERRAGARHSSPDVAGADADQSDRERGRDHRDCQMGRCARR